MANPNVQAGPLNRLVASVTYTTYTQLNVTPSFLAPEAIRMSFGGQVTTGLPTLTGYVQSPEPYQMVTVSVHLIRSQALADLYKQQVETNSNVGDFTIRPDTRSGIGPYIIGNGSIVSVDALAFAGRDAGFTVTLQGSYQINSAMWP